MLEGQLASSRFPIGKTEVIRHAPASLLREYYHANYRPERAALVIIGDIDPAQIETEIKARFAEWRPSGPALPEPDLGAVRSRGLTVKALETPGSAAQIHVNWTRPYDRRPASDAKRREGWLKYLALAVLNRRLDELAHGKKPPFLSAGSSYANMARSLQTTSIVATFAPEAPREALAAIEQEQRRLVQHGVTRQELEREIGAARTSLENAKAGAATRLTGDLASGLVDGVDKETVFTTPDYDLSHFEKSVNGLAVEEVNALARELFSGAGPLVFAAAPSLSPNAEAELASEYARSQEEPVSAPAAEAAKIWPYASFGEPGQVVERREDSEHGVTFVRFANGVRLTVKPTGFRAEQVLVKARVGAGKLDFPKDRPVNDWLTAALVDGGLKALTSREIQSVLAAKHFSLSVVLDEDALLMQGAARPADLDVQLQVLTAFITDPAYRAESFDLARNKMQSLVSQLEATASGVLARDLPGLLRRDDLRWRYADAAQIAAARAEDVKALHEGLLSGGAIELAVVGDVTPEAAIKVAAATLGALPARPDPRSPASVPEIRFPETPGEPVVLRHKGRADDAIAYVAWPTTDWYADRRLSEALGVAAHVLANRLTEEFRATEGAAYSAMGDSSMSLSFPGYGYVWAAAGTRPEKVAAFQAKVSRIVAEMRTQGVSGDELARAKTPLVEGFRKAEQSNEYLLDCVAGAHADPRQLALTRRSEGFARVTAEDVKEAAARYLSEERIWKLVVLPSAEAVAATEQPVVK